ncbi:MAG: CarD family transcriptional regulator [Lachnospiraceae bacterium]|nr:CarD family transcriptional regulator [Lachnospiraceae bacterium]
MFKIDEYVVHTTGGICKVTSIDSLDIPGADKSKKYYLLVPIKAAGSKVYVPVDNDSAIRPITTSDEAIKLIDEIPAIEELTIENDRFREAKYKEVIKSCDLHELISVLKNLYFRRLQRISEGKKNTATDDKYFKIAEENLLSELSFVLHKNREEVKTLVADKITV